MRDFTMTKYWNQYQEAATRLGVLDRQIEGLTAILIYADDVEAAQAKLEAAKAERQALAVEVDDLRCKAHTGRGWEALSKEATVQCRRV